MLRPEDSIPLPPALAGMRRFPMDGALLLFDRATGWNALCDGPETAHLRPRAPRVVQFGITNACNLSCAFCSRDQGAPSAWTAAEAFTVLADLAEAGVLEVAFGGGEPLVFPGLADLVRRLHHETPLAVNLTTNGLRLTPALLAELAPHLGELRLSLHPDNDWSRRVELLTASGVRYGVNLLVTPTSLDAFEATVLDLVARGCRHVLALSYLGPDAALHLAGHQSRDLGWRVCRLAGALRGRARIELSVCWGDRLAPAPRLFERADCGAGRDFVVLTSDKRVQPCSFHHVAIEAPTAAAVLGHWRAAQAALAVPATSRGCARTAAPEGLGVAV